MNELPQFIRDMLSSPPVHGEGVHQWLYRVARQLHAHRSEDDICALLKALTEGCGRGVPDGEILSAVRNSYLTAWRPGDAGKIIAPRAPQWPACNQKFRRRIIDEIGYGLYDLWEGSPCRFSDDDDEAAFVVPSLFCAADLICVGQDKNVPLIAALNQWGTQFATFQFIVPSPMRALSGINQNGVSSARCLDNTGPRRYLVIEFDRGTLDEQAALLIYLGTLSPIVVAVFSGSKSLHGWFATQQIEKPEEFFALACRLGADRATWPKCQFVRMPGGTREGGARQKVYWFAPVFVPHEHTGHVQ
jgi:hypothetical protein